ncbi:MAG: hypothetical protein GY737_31290 [Desulfobacteraceae bacterium]|nr:hypothetical protein [Desulfobacteraceae bacterium]
MNLENYREMKMEGFKLTVAKDLDTGWLGKLISNLEILPPVPYATKRHRGFVALPPGGGLSRAFVKTYAHTDEQHRAFRRKHPLRRLFPRYAVKEGLAYLNFQRAGLAVPGLLAFGEEWKWGIRNRGIIVIEAVQAPSLQELLHKTRDTAWIDRIFETMARIHGAGVTHGDAHLVNFLGRDQEVLSIDIESSKPLSPKRQRTELVNVLVSIFREINDEEPVRAGIKLYETQTGQLLSQKDELIEIAINKVRAARGNKTKDQMFSAASSEVLTLK